MAWAVVAAVPGGFLSAAQSAFDTIGLAPSEANLVVCIERGAEHRDGISKLPIVQPALRFLQRSRTYQAWSEMLASGGSGSGGSGGGLTTAFDEILGERVLFASAQDAGDWALYGEAPQESIEAVLKALQAQTRQPVAGVAVLSIEAGRFIVAEQDGRWLLGPTDAPAMFGRMAPLLRGERPDQSLSETDAYRQARFVGSGDAALFIRREGDTPTEFSAAVVRYVDEAIEVSFVMQSAALGTALTSATTIDAGLVTRLSLGAGLVIVEPIPAISPDVHSILRMMLPDVSVDPEVRAFIGPRNALVMRPGHDGTGLELFWALEIRNAGKVERSLDDMIDRGLESFGLAVRDTPQRPGQLRSVDLTEALDQSAPLISMALARKKTVLGWRMFAGAPDPADATRTGWWVIGIPADQVQAVGKAITADDPTSPDDAPRCLSRGYLSGASSADMIPNLPLAYVDDVRALLRALGDCTWSVRRTSDRSLEGSVRLVLHAPDASPSPPP
ncbi:MAG: hypothetical protein KAS72_14555 [Phycisphaerales bacterium]|nr:hypothetical protein [Phycisphaerales bacterium]